MRRIHLFALAIATILPLPVQAYRMASWIAPWDSRSLSSIQMYGGSLSESNPVWYTLDASGRITPVWNAENETWRAAMSGTDIIPTIQNVVNGGFNDGVVRSLISTAAAREAHAEAITRLVVEKGYQGIDIDYEALPKSDRADFSAFITTLGSKLHSAGRVLSVTVHPKTSDSQDWTGPGAQDYAAIGAAADTVKLMVYDFHWSTSGPGTITPLDWMDKVVSYASSVIPANKVIVGLPLYGYDWQGNRGKGVVYEEAIALARANNATIQRDAHGEPWFTYGDHTVFFQDATSYARKVQHVTSKHPNIGGFAHWRSGGEDAGVWTGTSGSSEPVLNPDFTATGPVSLSLEAGKSASGSYKTTAVDGFSSTISVSVAKIGSYPASLSLSSRSVQPGGSVTLNVSTPTTDAGGTYAAVVRFVSGSITREVVVNISVSPAPAPVLNPDFTAAGPASLSLTAGDSTSATYRTTVIDGFSSPISVSVVKLGSYGASLSLSSSTIQPGGSVVLDVKTKRNDAGGTYPAIVRFTSGGITREVPVTITVAPAAPTKKRGVGR